MQIFFRILLIAMVPTFAASQQTVELASNGLVHSLALKFKDCERGIIIVDGKYGSLSFDNGPTFRFIAKTNTATGNTEILPIHEVKYTYKGREVDGLRIGNPLVIGETTNEMKAMGLLSVKVVKSAPLKTGGIDQSGVVAKPAIQSLVCTIGDTGCSGDGCGYCCIG